MNTENKQLQKMSVRLFFLIYDFFLVPIAISFLLSLGLIFSNKIRRGFNLRKTKVIPTLKDGCIWIHASSGEFEYAKPVVTELKKKYPETKIVVTYYSPSYAAQIEQYAGVDYALPLPFETKAAVRGFVQKINPKALLIARTDLWPQVLRVCHKQNIPTLLFSCTFREPHGARRWAIVYYKFLFNFLSDIYTASEIDQQNIQKELQFERVQTKGDTRYDQVLRRLLNPKPVKDIFQTTTPTMVAGSTWPSDESVLLKGLQSELKNSRLRLILAPHEPSENHLKSIEQLLLQYNIDFDYYSKSQNWAKPVLIIDQIGILAELYTKGSAAFVGGSFKDKVHSVMEPLAAGLPVIVGPHHQNNREAIVFASKKLGFGSLHFVNAVTDSETLQKVLLQILENSAHKTQIQEFIQNQVRKNTGATRHILSWIESHTVIHSKY